MKPYRTDPELVFRREGKGGLVFDPRTGELFVLNETAAFLWNLCDGKRPNEALAESVRAKYDISPAAARRELRSFLAELSAGKFIVRAK